MTGKTIGRNVNEISVVSTTTIEVNDTTATILSVRNLKRSYFTIMMATNVLTSAVVHIRYYPAGDDNLKHVTDILTKLTTGNKPLLNDRHVMHHDEIFTGEISAITDVGTFDLDITEG